MPGFGSAPAIAVLAFDNLSDDPEQEYFADGIAEDLITRLSSRRLFPVIARNSSFAYKGQAMNVQQVGRELGARYVLEGSVRRSGGRVRINAQLIDASSGAHLWADRYGRQPPDVFEPPAGTVADALVSSRSIRVDGEDREAPVYDRLALPEGAEIPGPAILEQPDTTIFLDPGLTGRVDRFGNVILTRGG